MTPPHATDLVEFLQDTVEDALRSVIHYHEDGHEVVYVREDIAPQYSDEEITDIVQDLGIEAFGKSMQEKFYVHGDLHCTVRCFEDAIEMNFLANQREGIAVALDAEAFAANRTFIGKCMDIAGTG